MAYMLRAAQGDRHNTSPLAGSQVGSSSTCGYYSIITPHRHVTMTTGRSGNVAHPMQRTRIALHRRWRLRPSWSNA